MLLAIKPIKIRINRDSINGREIIQRNTMNLEGRLKTWIDIRSRATARPALHLSTLLPWNSLEGIPLTHTLMVRISRVYYRIWKIRKYQNQKISTRRLETQRRNASRKKKLTSMLKDQKSINATRRRSTLQYRTSALLIFKQEWSWYRTTTRCISTTTVSGF